MRAEHQKGATILKVTDFGPSVFRPSQRPWSAPLALSLNAYFPAPIDSIEVTDSFRHDSLFVMPYEVELVQDVGDFHFCVGNVGPVPVADTAGYVKWVQIDFMCRRLHRIEPESVTSHW